jgi:hypothetical protein
VLSPHLHLNTSLRLHAFGLSRLHDPSCAGADLIECVRPYRPDLPETPELLHKTLPDGVLFLLGRIAFRNFLQTCAQLRRLRGEYVLWHLEGLIEFVEHHAPENQSLCLLDLKDELQDLDDTYDFDEGHYIDRLRSRSWLRSMRSQYKAVVRENESLFQGAIDHYARDFAERVFHDRHLSSYVAALLVTVGFNGSDDLESTPRAWVQRAAIPSWATRALLARERGKCALCAANLALELSHEPHVDHIVPLALGGSNDLVNLQILCGRCNGTKGVRPVSSTSSVPPYLQHALQRASRRRTIV